MYVCVCVCVCMCVYIFIIQKKYIYIYIRIWLYKGSQMCKDGITHSCVFLVNMASLEKNERYIFLTKEIENLEELIKRQKQTLKHDLEIVISTVQRFISDDV